jgi:hypothetical protein
MEWWPEALEIAVVIAALGGVALTWLKWGRD